MLIGKKGFAGLLLGSLLLTTACGSNGGNGGSEGAATGSEGQSPSASESPVASPSETPAPQAPVTIEFWYGLGGKLGENMQTLIDKFNASQQEVIVKPVVQADYSETGKKLQAAIASGDVPAAVLSSNVDWARKGYYASIDDLIAANSDFNAADVIPTFLEQGKVDGKQYFLPMYGTTQVMYYSKEALEKNGIKAENLTTWEALGEAAAKMTVKSGGKTTFYGWEPMWGADNMIDATLSKGGSILSEDGKTVTIDSAEWIDTWEQFRKWIHEDQIMRIHYGGQGWEYWYKTIDDVMKGNAAGYTGSSGDQGDLDFTKLAAMEQPGWEGVGEGKPVASAIQAGIPAKASPEQQQAAFKWFSFFMSPENTAFWSMNTGYIAVRQSALDDPAFVEYSAANPQSTIPLKQAAHASEPFQDPTGGKINDALKIAADKVQISNVPAAEALKEAKATAQRELDKLK
ncbi:ABC transporter substrate-binding protein [Cohnella sp. CIP 111063]|uniref:extracellular solute-binding protein n=1 Tax=unclassified Cohnella TaxID=2636738 RepID=UPI000B8BD8BB|nr:MULTISPECIES: extracellular solute-binding protein [unclassified Cohnella]OXS54027.1 ABC transporter substrate-binding protein [Cohnella sp. CIP 111063]PRX62899.1 carbohydrate ABC transporter substrate-binding protein (CUT1 family) [Cohnella sp. SGD-V74]